MRTFVAILVTLSQACSPPAPRVRHQRYGAGPGQVSTQIKVDQFGYRPGDDKVAVITDPQQGFNAADSFTPGDTYEVRRWSDGQSVLSVKVSSWNGGQTQASSGDRGWWLDFSALSTPGSYYLFDVSNQVGSHRFEVGDAVYNDVLKTATRMYFYNRAGAAKKPPYADIKWQDDAAYLGPGQDGEARSVTDKSNPQTALDLRGGWFDAGDTNKYVTFAHTVVHQLLSAYTENPAVWSDSFNIPESGNGVPDLIDEIKWEVDWVRRMQRTDGGVLIKVGVLDHTDASPPSKDISPRYYAPKCSSSTIAAASMFAHAALVFDTFAPLKSDAVDLRDRAIKAWDWYHQNPKKTDCDSQEIKA
ncbi:MAG: glycoside hydrolase family 9 protein, partial [Deltaproteobacteria bacterium]|nr:glycoside hydrolase family 9 protein [Deltaproteobacteria bacterium]